MFTLPLFDGRGNFKGKSDEKAGTESVVDFFDIVEEFISFAMLQRYVRRSPPGDLVSSQIKPS
jgi:hypothetical protein